MLLLFETKDGVLQHHCQPLRDFVKSLKNVEILSSALRDGRVHQADDWLKIPFLGEPKLSSSVRLVM